MGQRTVSGEKGTVQIEARTVPAGLQPKARFLSTLPVPIFAHLSSPVALRLFLSTIRSSGLAILIPGFRFEGRGL